MRRAFGPGLFTAAVLVLAGCSGGNGSAPVSLPTLGTARPTATSAAVIREDVPAAARTRDSFGAAAFARFYYEQVDRAFAGADSTLLQGLSNQQCGTCKAFEQSARKLAADGERIKGTSVRVIFSEAPEEQGGQIGVSLTLDAPARVVTNASGQVTQRLAATPRYNVTLTLVWSPNGWAVLKVADA